MEIDDKTLEAIREINRMMQGPPAPPIQMHDRDSFASFTSGLRNNWMFVMAMVAVMMWGFNKLSTIDSINVDQDRRISTNAQDIAALTGNISNLTSAVDTKFDNLSNTNNDVIRRLDSLQKDIDVIKGNK